MRCIVKRAPKPTRRLRKTIAGAIEQGRSALRSTWGQLTIEAAWSLRMGARPAAIGISVLDGCEPSDAEQQRAADMIHARVLDILEAAGRTHYGSSTIEAERAELVARQGAGFLEQVAATGEPAHRAALRIASVLALVFVFLGALPPAKMGLSGSHKIHAVNFLARARAAFEDALCTWFCGGSGRVFTGGFRQRSRVGRSVAHSSSPSEGRPQRSSFGLTLARTMRRRSSSSPRPSSQSDAQAGRSSELLNARRCASSVGERSERTPEEWALYRLRVQNVLLSVGGEL